MSNDTPETITIQLTQGQVTVIDAKHADLAEMKWHAHKDKKKESGWYAKRANKGVSTILARVILERMIGRPLEKHERADHIDGNTLDNRESNLRVASCLQNQRNQRKRKDNTSGYKGVNRHYNGKYRAYINNNGKQIYLGLFSSAELAYEAYCFAARDLFGEFARLE